MLSRIVRFLCRVSAWENFRISQVAIRCLASVCAMTTPHTMRALTTEVPDLPGLCTDGAPFQSILFPSGTMREDIDGQIEPECFPDLNLDKIVGAITKGREEYRLEPFFYAPSRDVATIHYRHDVFRDLENQTAADAVRSFASGMQTVRSQLAQADKLYYEPQKQRWLLDAVHVYCEVVRQFAGDLALAHLRSNGFVELRQHLDSYIGSKDFSALETETQRIGAELGAIRYSLHIEGKRVTVSSYSPEPDYGVDVLETFEKFRQGTTKEYRFSPRSNPDMNHVEAAILDRVAWIHPEVFSLLEGYYSRYRTFLNPAIARFDREVQFYLGWIEYTQRLGNAGLSFCLPVVSDRSKEAFAREAFDLAFAENASRESVRIVTNDFSLSGQERIIVVSGPNQGGKTTFARMFGQLHFLASIGCPVPAREAKLFLGDRLFTHFEKEEDVENLTGKLENQLLRIHRILGSATSDSILIMNESFLSTTLNDALALSRRIMERILSLDMVCLSVTFLDELASLSPTAVSMVSTVDRADPIQRTFKIIRKPADGLAYAMALAEKHGLTGEAVMARINGNAKGRKS
jgi:DNA mismatch repair ATPase MutS